MSDSQTAAWPSGCHDRGSCKRHRICMYHQCVHAGKGSALGNEVDAATANIPRGRGHQNRINAAMAHLDRRAEDGRCGEMVAEMLAAADAVLLQRLPTMRDARGTIWVEFAALQGLLQHWPDGEVG